MPIKGDVLQPLMDDQQFERLMNEFTSMNRECLKIGDKYLKIAQNNEAKPEVDFHKHEQIQEYLAVLRFF